MLKILYQIIIGLIIALGSLHTVLTRCNYEDFSIDAMWFFGTGIAIILAGFFNIACLRHGKADKLIQALCIVSNLIFTAIFAAATFLLPEPQVYLGIALFALASLFALLTGKI